MTWTSPFPDPVVDGPTTGRERAILEGMLDWQRRTFLNVCAGLDADQLAARPVRSTGLSLLGLARHLAKVERVWFRKRVAGEDVPHLYDFESHDDTDFRVIDPADAEQALSLLVSEQRAAARSVGGIDLDHEIAVHGSAMSLRMVHVHVIGEYARHNGHADLLREAIDGVTAR
jgi:uncharacterized damage-inducible protein DinB